jgi:hypothetical protein
LSGATDEGSELKAVFEDIATHNKWRNSESRSGAGSTLIYTINLRSQLEVFTRKFRVKSFFDAPCGDFNWMREVHFPRRMRYLGGDIASSLIAANSQRYTTASTTFRNFDIVADPFPEADVWFCRDCLFHLSNNYILQALRNFCGSDIKLLMMTNHINATGFANTDIKSGQFRLVDFYQAPFRLPREVLFRIADYVHPFPPREMCVWTREQIAAALGERL